MEKIGQECTDYRNKLQEQRHQEETIRDMVAFIILIVGIILLVVMNSNSLVGKIAMGPFCSGLIFLLLSLLGGVWAYERTISKLDKWLIDKTGKIKFTAGSFDFIEYLNRAFVGLTLLGLI